MGYDQHSSQRSPMAPGNTVKRKLSPRFVLIGVAGLAAVLFAVYHFSGDSASTSGTFAAGPKGRGGAAPPVHVAQATVRDVPVVMRTIGTVLANSVVNVKSQVAGQMRSAGFKEGQLVKTGDVLFRIDPDQFDAALRQAQATVTRDEAQLAAAQNDANRAVQLADRGIVSAQQRDQLVASAKALAATLAADQAAADRARLNVNYTTIRSPINGKTGPMLIQPGNQVSINDTLLTVTQIQPVKITFDMPQTSLPQLQDRMNEDQLIASVSMRSDVAAAVATANDAPAGERDIRVKVDFIGNEVNAQSGTIELRATFENPDLRLVPGELVDVSVQLNTLKSAVTIPREAVNAGQDGNYVYVLDKDKKAQVHPIRILFQDDSSVAIGTGVSAGDSVVTDGQLRLTPGIAVNVMRNPAGGEQGNGQHAGGPVEDSAGITP